MTTTLDHVAEALEALRAVLMVPVVLDTATAEVPADTATLVIVRFVDGTRRPDYEQNTARVMIQVDSYAETLEDALNLAEACEAALAARGFTFRRERKAPAPAGEPLTGMSRDFER